MFLPMKLATKSLGEKEQAMIS